MDDRISITFKICLTANNYIHVVVNSDTNHA